jgi:nuclear pore complex protein Nup93
LLLFPPSQHHDTLQAIESSGLLPFDGDVQAVTKKTESFKDYDEAIIRNLSHILLLAMNILHGMHGKAKHALFGEGSRQAVSAFLSKSPWSCS